MYYIKNEDYEYIKNKYHDSSKPWKNDSNRFICNEGLFDEKTGFYSCTVPVSEQYVIAEFINNGDFQRHIKVRQVLPVIP